ncbi:MAG: FAD-dependent oxidoreductase [Deltaproteobacteria bacterium]|nr:FAD-dependent oxidoreductase [Deltaproteobacteria bacterium]
MGIPVRLPDLEAWKAQVSCQAGCPVQTDAGRYAQLIAAGRDEEAFLVARAPNPFASVCGRVCAAPCEDACRRRRIDAPVAIRALKRSLTEKFGAESLHPETQDQLRHALVAEGNRYAGHLPTTPLGPQAKKRKVAVVGAGPAGLAAAHDLAHLGYQVTVFEAGDEPGGMMRYGIPEYRLPRALIRAEIDQILGLGVELRLKTGLTSSSGLAALKRDGYEAVFLAVGVQKGRELALPGAEIDGVVRAVDYLLNANRGYRMELGRNVVVIGGGFVAFDAARTALRVGEDEAARLAAASPGTARLQEAFDSARAALRAGARDVTVVSLETFAEMPVLKSTQGHDEFEEAKREGVRFVTRQGPKRFLGDTRLKAVELRRVRSVFDPGGRFAPTYDDADVTEVAADTCILAIGQCPDLSFLTAADQIELTAAGTIKVDPATLATSATGIFAGGDVAFGPRNLIEAVQNGKQAARSIHDYLSGETAERRATIAVEKIPTRSYRTIAGFELIDRRSPPTLSLDRRTGISEVESGFEDAAARAQAARCLNCHVQTIYDPEKCVLCSRCVDVCPEHCLALVPFAALALPASDAARLAHAAGDGSAPLAAMIKDDSRCIRCGLCAIRCPTDAMTMERFAITERLQGEPRAQA